MALRLKKLDLPNVETIEAMDKSDLLPLAKECIDRIKVYEALLFKARREKYNPSSERSERPKDKDPKPKSPRGPTAKKPSDRYPDARIEVVDINFPDPPPCPACGEAMQDSGMAETTEYLDVRPKEFIVIEQRRHKHRCCKCHSAIVTAPAPPRITPGGSYSDEMIVDITVSKFAELTPIDRYSRIAGHNGLPNLPPHSLIKASFQLGNFMEGVYDCIKAEVLKSPVMSADETPHRMLEGDEKKRWFLWGFSNAESCFFECHDTRSGDVSTDILNLSECLVLVSDAYCGYGKSIRLANELRVANCRPFISSANCNAHARREFWKGDSDSSEMTTDQKIVIDLYKEIYKLNKESKNLSPDEILAKREQMKPYFEAIKAEAEAKKNAYSERSQMATAYGYFLNNYAGLTLFLTNYLVPIDNNSSERLLRSHVVGRKTWYGTHSRAGAHAAAIHFTIIESCKLNKLNPREYYLDAIDRIHSKSELLTPHQYKMRRQVSTA